MEDVRCVALDTNRIEGNTEVKLGPSAKNDEDICRFKIKQNTTEPLRFEIHYNGKIRKEVCNWQSVQPFTD